MCVMTLWLIAINLSKLHSSQNGFELTLTNPDPNDFGLCKPPIAAHCFSTIDAVIEYLGEHRQPFELSIPELKRQLSERLFSVIQVSKENAVGMGFKF
jgi:hypothetical protein